MDTEVVAVLVTGLVSLLSLVANIYIARRSRQTTERMLKIQAYLDNTKLAIEDFREFETETERLRILCWDLLGQIEAQIEELSEPNAGPSAPVSLGESFGHFEKRVVAFQDAWAPVKPELPKGLDIYIRRVRHKCREKLGQIGLQLKIISLKRDKPDDLLHRLELTHDLLADVLQDLDKLAEVSTAIRRGMVEDAYV